ncbi:MAG: 1-deoxy-D-xylulose-5-phosphate reductoisomerase [Clostridiales bacterium]|nr:MAG: 1-deoxy-D-xylulose-5-phosphate reductoisomerase [Clostridiales bacterium]
MSRKKVAVLGSTGSIGKSSLDVIRKYSSMLELSAISCHTNAELLEKQAREFSPRFAAVSGLDRVQQDIFGGTKTGCGEEALLEACEGADIVVLAIVGMAALRPFEFCLKNDIPVALANKESLVCGGRLIRDIMDRRGSQVLPVDSETFAISECISRRKRAEIRSVLLTASGGPFRTASEEVIRNATPEMALAHPNWAMGKKISVDCATMINKGLEIMETRWLFDIDPSRIRVVVHPESIVHSMAEFTDHSIMAHMAVADMRLPIAGALLSPEIPVNAVGRLNLFEVGALHFEAPAIKRFPCLGLAYEAINNEGIMPIVLNAANEVAVQKFLNREFPMGGIFDMVSSAMDKFGSGPVGTLDEVFEIDKTVREYCTAIGGIQ